MRRTVFLLAAKSQCLLSCAIPVVKPVRFYSRQLLLRTSLASGLQVVPPFTCSRIVRSMDFIVDLQAGFDGKPTKSLRWTATRPCGMASVPRMESEEPGRVAQLTQRTNQMNFTTIRRTVAE
jgi:hypothetical protein